MKSWKTRNVLALVLLVTAAAWLALPAQEQNPPPGTQQVTPQPPPEGGVRIKPAEQKPAQAPPTKVAPHPHPAAPQPPPPPPVDPEKAPKVIIASTEFDAGVITKGESIKHDFIIENQGKGPLEIIKVSPACGCTLSEHDKTIEVGKKGKISLVVNTTSFKGPISKSTSVQTNDPAMSNFQLIIKAEIKELLSVQPSENQQLGLLFKGQKIEREYTLKSTDDSAFQITEIESTDPALKYELKMGEDKKSAVFKVIVPEDHAVGPITGRFTLKTTHPKVPTLQLNAYGTIREPLTLYPTEINYSGLSKSYVDEHPQDNSLTKPITITYETGNDLEVKEVNSSLPFVKATLETLEQGKRYSVKVQLQPPLTVGDFSGKVAIVTSKKTIEVPVRGKIF